MLAAVSAVSLCEGIRREDAGQGAVAECADFCALVRGPANEIPSVSAKLEVVGGDAVCWSSKCPRVLGAEAAAAAAANFSDKDKPGGAARRCIECTKFLDSVLLPRVRESAAASASAASGAIGGGGGSVGDEEREDLELEAGRKRRVTGFRYNSTADDTTTHLENIGVDEERRENVPLAAGMEREKASVETCRVATDDASICQKVDKLAFCFSFPRVYFELLKTCG